MSFIPVSRNSIDVTVEVVGTAPVAACPGNFGGKDWTASAYSPETGALIIPLQQACARIAGGKVEFKDGGGGIGSGPGLSIGAALALRDSGRLVVSVLGDGDCMMGVNAFWTAARYGIPILAIIGNNRSYYNDELHQEGVA